MTSASRGTGRVLVGLRRAGKTLVGRSLAAALGRPFVDVDALVLERTGRTSAAWIRDAGLAAFREAEAEAVRAAASVAGAVIATGGGSPLREDNRAALAAGGRVIYLRLDPWTAARRAAEDPDAASRPPLAVGSARDEAFALFVERDATYRAFADAIVDASPAVERVVAACVALRGVAPGFD